MNLTSIEKISALRSAAHTLQTLVATYNKYRSEPSCDKHDLKFGGDDRFNIFAVKIHLSGYRGYFGSSGCSSFADVNNELAQKFLTQYLNKHRDEVLQEMGEWAHKEAATLVEEGQAELDGLQALLTSAKFATTT